MTGDAAECRCGAKVDANVEGVEMSANAVLQLMWIAGLNARLLNRSSRCLQCISKGVT